MLAERARESAALDEIWWMPAGNPPHKTIAGGVSAVYRLAMTRLATEGNPHFVVREDEVHKTTKSYTVETLRALQTDYPEHTFFLIIGGDSLRDFHTWFQPDEIVARCTLLVYRRPDADLSQVEARFLTHTQFVEAPQVELSSTEIRSRVQHGKSIRYLVPDTVAAYLTENGLYRTL